MRTRTTRALIASSLAGLLAAGAALVIQPVAAAQDSSPGILATCTDPAWSASAIYVGGNQVSHDDHGWRAKWWTQGEEPGVTTSGVWEDLGGCEAGTPPPPGDCLDPPWSASTIYVGGDRVSHNSRTWRAKWWTQGEQPGVTTSGVWEDLGACAGEPTDPPPSDPPPTDPPPPPPPSGEVKTIGYFTQWGIYERAYLIRNVHTSGQAEDLTHIHYAFGNVNEQGRCFMANQLGQGDSWADYQRRFTSAESVDGVADTFNQPLAGNFNQIRELKQLHPHLRVMFSLGGWTWSRFFSNAALPQNREAFVASCINLFIKGNLPVFGGEPQGGPGSAFGVFDGFDLDWEWPASEGNAGNVIRPEDRTNFTALVAEFRRQLDAFGAQVGRDYELSAFLPADPAKVQAGFQVPEIFNHLDYATVQGYDFYGPWLPQTNHQGQLRNPPANPAPANQRFSGQIAVNQYLSRGAPAGKLALGLPAYARGWANVANVNNGLYQNGSAVPVIPGKMFEAGIMDYKHVITEPGTVFRDNTHGAVWKFGSGRFWSYDDPQLITAKGNFVEQNGLGGLMIWSLDGDSNGTLVNAMHNSLN
jgi:chitinase